MLVMLDTETGKVVTTVPIGSGADGCAFDAKTQLAFASCGEGVTTIAKEETPDKLVVVQTLTTAPRARTIALDPQTHRIYLPTAAVSARAIAFAGRVSARPTVIANTMKLLVYGPGDSEAVSARSDAIPNETRGDRFFADDRSAQPMRAGRSAHDHRRSGHAGQRTLGEQSRHRLRTSA